MSINDKKSSKKRRIPVFTILSVIIFFIALFLGFKNLKFKQDLKNIQSSSYTYDIEYLKEKARKINPAAVVVHNQDKERWDESKRPRLVKELTFGDIEGDDPNKMFHRIIFVRPDIAGNIYVNEYNISVIKKFDREGNYLLSIGNEGGGPGEFRGFLLYFLDGDSILTVYDTGNQRVSRFTTDGKYLSSFRLIIGDFSFPKSIARDDGGNFYFSYIDLKQNTTIHKYDSRGNHVLSFGEPLELKLTNPHVLRTFQKNHYPGSLFYNNHQIFFSQYNPYFIAIYSPQGKLLRQITRKNRFMSPPAYKIKGKEHITISRWVTCELIAKIHTYLINVIYFPETYSEDPRTVFDIFDLDGNLLTSIEIDERIYPQAIAQNGNFYGVVRTQDGFEQVVRYSIKFQ